MLRDLVLFEREIDLGTIETYDNSATDVEHWDAALTRFIDGIESSRRIGFDVLIVVFNTEFIEIIFGGVTEGTPGRAVDDYVLVSHASSISLYIVK